MHIFILLLGKGEIIIILFIKYFFWSVAQRFEVIGLFAPAIRVGKEKSGKSMNNIPVEASGILKYRFKTFVLKATFWQ